MAGLTVSQLPEKSEVSSQDYLLIEDRNETQKIKVENLLGDYCKSSEIARLEGIIEGLLARIEQLENKEG